MVTLSTLVYDLLGHIVLREQPASDTENVSRRVSRVKTMDGGAVSNDGGYSAGDETFVIRWNPRDKDEYRKVQRLVMMYPQLRVSHERGVFLASPQSLAMRGKTGVLTLLILESLT